MLNGIFLVLIAGSVLTAAFRGTMPRVTEASLTAAKASVDLALGLIGQMALWLGMMAIVREGGLLRSIARGLRPLMRRLFPEVPDDHPAMGSMILNLAANMLGLGNAATPFGLKAMTELNTLNRYPGVATNSMALFLSINAAGVAILPLGAVAVRAALGSKDPAGIVLPSFLSTFSAALTAVVVAKLLEKRARFRPERYTPEPGKESTAAAKGPDAAALEKAEQLAVDHAPASPRRRAIALGLLALFLVALVREAVRVRAEHPGFDLGPGAHERVDPPHHHAGDRALRPRPAREDLRGLHLRGEGRVPDRHRDHPLPGGHPGGHRDVPRLGRDGHAHRGALPGHLPAGLSRRGTPDGAHQAAVRQRARWG